MTSEEEYFGDLSNHVGDHMVTEGLRENPGTVDRDDDSQLLSSDDYLLLSLYRESIREAHFYTQTHHSRIAFYVGVVTAIVGITGVGLFRATEWWQFGLMALGPLLIIMICFIGSAATFRMYQRLLEAITVRAKIEQLLGLTTVGRFGFTKGGYWQSEPIVPVRHIKDRCEDDSSGDFIANRVEGGYRGPAKKLFLTLQVLSIILIGIIVSLAATAAGVV